MVVNFPPWLSFSKKTNREGINMDKYYIEYRSLKLTKKN